jgi:thiol:disulfide interchange protein DsbD
MALALAIVSFSCTGPIVGTLLVEAAGIAQLWNVWFSLALAYLYFCYVSRMVAFITKIWWMVEYGKVVLGF